MVKPGYYMDEWDDICIRYPDGSWEIVACFGDYGTPYRVSSIPHVWDKTVLKGKVEFIAEL